MVNITDEDWKSKEHTTSNTINAKAIPQENIEKRLHSHNSYSMEHLKYKDISSEEEVHDFRKNIPPFNPRPEYYGGKDTSYEVFNVLEAWKLDKDFYLGNVLKYLARAGKKNYNKKEDLQKASVYLQRRIDTL